VEWNLRTCARKGHATYRPDEPELAARLRVETAVGVAWRCLRCGDFTVGEPVGAGPASEAPILLRGRALRDAMVLRILALERLVRAVLLVLIGYAVLRFRHSQVQAETLFDRALPAARPLANVLHLDLDHSPTVHHLRHLIYTQPRTLLLVAVLMFGYAAIQLGEGIGLWLLKRWGEYFAVVATALFLPLEAYELSERVTWLRVGALLINVAAVVYLVVSKRLFGVRGGHAAFEAERREAAILEVDQAAEVTPGSEGATPAEDRDTATPPADATLVRGTAGGSSSVP
jgi:uncharacterized membrane protein (DUF2068 family)